MKGRVSKFLTHTHARHNKSGDKPMRTPAPRVWGQASSSTPWPPTLPGTVGLGRGCWNGDSAPGTAGGGPAVGSAQLPPPPRLLGP